MIRIFMVTFLPLVLAASVASTDSYEVPPSRSGGGSIDAYVDHINELNRTHTPVTIDLPACYSACTFYLLADQVCTSPRTVFGFHGPQNLVLGLAGIPIRGMRQQHIDITIAVMVANYDQRWPGLGEWFAENAAHKFGYSYTFVRGQALHDSFGIPLCK